MDKKRIQNYENKYIEDYDFEKEMVFYRQKFLKQLIYNLKPQKVLEIGCGFDLLFDKIKDYNFIKSWTIIEPSKKFIENAKMYIDDRCELYQGFFEEFSDSMGNDFDLIICSSLLHEIKNPNEFLQKTYQNCNKNTILHINVPNAYSFHRELAYYMGYIKDVFQKSNRNVKLNQYHIFDKNKLENMVNQNFSIIDKGGYFIKPFTHAQMIKVMDIFNDGRLLLDGLYKLGIKHPELASEIYINCKKIENEY